MLLRSTRPIIAAATDVPTRRVPSKMALLEVALACLLLNLVEALKGLPKFTSRAPISPTMWADMQTACRGYRSA